MSEKSGFEGFIHKGRQFFQRRKPHVVTNLEPSFKPDFEGWSSKLYDGRLTPEEQAQFDRDLLTSVERYESLEQEYLSKPRPLGWQMTDPAHHDPDNFRYIVHAINYNNDFVPSLKGQSLRSFIDHSAQRDLNGFLKREVTSASMIDELHTYTYAQAHERCHGFIFHVPEKNIVAVYPDDIGKPWDIESEDAAREVRPEAFKLRAETHSAQAFTEHWMEKPSYYNEVLVNGIGKGGNVKINGIFLIVDPILQIPLYDIYARMTPDALQEYEKFKKNGLTDEQMLDPKYFGPTLYKSEKTSSEIIKKRHQEANDLAELLNVPIIPIPADFPYKFYRKNIFSPGNI